MRCLAIAAIVLAFFSSELFAASLSDFIGEWKGKGTFTRQSKTEREGRLTCRLRIVAKGESAIIVNGRCAAPEGSRGFQTLITGGNDGLISGAELSRIGAQQSRTSAGTLDNSGISLAGKDARGHFEFRLSAPQSGRMEMQSASTENGKSETARVQLRKSK